MSMVRADLGQYNWVLVAPGGAEPALIDAGNGSVEQMRQQLRDDRVCFGLLRMGFGVGKVCRSSLSLHHRLTTRTNNVEEWGKQINRAGGPWAR